MRILFLTVATKAMLLSSTFVSADTSAIERSIIVEGGLSYGSMSRDGDALNPGANFREIDEFEVTTIKGFMSFPIGKSYLLQIEGNDETSNAPTVAPGGLATRDTLDNSSFIAAQFGRDIGKNHFLGLFAGTGRTEFIPTNNAQRRLATNFNVLGVSGAYHTQNWSFTGQFGHLESKSQNAESLTDLNFSRVLTQRFFNDGKTALNLSITMGSGDQDFDNANPNPTALRAYEIGVEHSLPFNLFGSTASAFASIERIELVEKNTNNNDIEDTVFSVGFNINFGAKSLRDRERRTAQRLPNFGRWIASAPALD